jgi:hypothetical protein
MPRNSDLHNYVHRDSSVGIVTRCRQKKRFCTYLQGPDGMWDHFHAYTVGIEGLSLEISMSTLGF